MPVRMIFPPAELSNPIWPCDPDYGIPMLRLDMQAEVVPSPLERWGRRGRGKRMAGTWHYYTDDYKFEGLWTHPQRVWGTRCKAVIETNFSIHEQTPRARVLYQTYRKRWLSRFWQEAGIRIVVDLNVASAHAQDNLIGVPKGWRSYATRGSAKEIDLLDLHLAIAKDRAGGDVSLLVYGGGRAVGEWCAEHGAAWVREEQDSRRDAQRCAGSAQGVDNGA